MLNKPQVAKKAVVFFASVILALTAAFFQFSTAIDFSDYIHSRITNILSSAYFLIWMYGRCFSSASGLLVFSVYPDSPKWQKIFGDVGAFIAFLGMFYQPV